MTTKKLPKGWSTCLLEDLITRMSNGANVKQYDEKFGYPITRIETIWNESIDLTRIKFIKENDPDFVEKYRLEPGDILFSHINSDSHLGKTAVFRNQTNTLIHGINLLLIRPFKNVLSEFLNYQFKFLRNSGTFIGIAQRAVNQSSINQKKLKSLIFLLPPLNEQKRIVAKIEELFSELDKGLENLLKAQGFLKIYRQTLLKAAFEGKLTEKWREENSCSLTKGKLLADQLINERQKNWPFGDKYKEPFQPNFSSNINTPKDWICTTLDVLCNIKGGLTVDAKREITDPVEIPYLRVANVQDGYLDIRHVKTIKADRKKVDQLLLKKGDVLFTEGGDIDKLGRGWVWEGQITCCTHQNHIFRARPYSQSVNSKYISYYCNVFGKAYFLKEGKQTTNLASIGLNKLRAFPITIPSLEEQVQIVSHLDETLSKIGELEQEILNQLAFSSLLRQSILKMAFSGQLVLQDSNDEPASELLDRIKSEKTDPNSSLPKSKKLQKVVQ